MIIGLAIPADLTEPAYTVILNDLSDYQSVVGGLVEPIDLATSLPGTLWCHEEGKLLGMEVNWRASALAWLRSDGQLGSEDPSDYIVGNCLITGVADEDGDSTDVSSKVLALTLDKEYGIAIKLAADRWLTLPYAFPSCLTAIGHAFRMGTRRPKTSIRIIPATYFKGKNE